jgi:hypothetical protein
VWKGDHGGRDVAVKVLRTYSNVDLQKIIGVSYWLGPLSACLCTETTCVEVMQGGRDVEIAPASECPAADRSDNV